MTNKPARFMVVLTSALLDSDAELMGPVLWRYAMPSGVVARALWCSELKASLLGPFVEAIAKRPADGEFVEVSVPTAIVLAIVGTEQQKALGFHWAADSPPQQP